MKFAIAALLATAQAVRLSDSPDHPNSNKVFPYHEGTSASAAGFVQTGFAVGMDGSEDFGENITIKRDKYHFAQPFSFVAQGEENMDPCGGVDGVYGQDCRVARFGDQNPRCSNPLLPGQKKGYNCIDTLAQVTLEDLPVCNGTNGSTESGTCRAAGSLVQKENIAARAEALVQYYLPTCTDQLTVDCQPVCTESLTVGCTEARTPNWPSADRFEGKYTHK